MPVTINRGGHRFRVTFSPGIPGTRGFTIDINTQKELDIALEHWYQGHGGGAPRPDCPLCKRTASRS